MDNALDAQDKSEVKGGQQIMTEDNKEIRRKEKYLALEPKIIALSKEGKKPSEIKTLLGEDSPGIPKIKRILAKSIKQ